MKSANAIRSVFLITTLVLLPLAACERSCGNHKDPVNSKAQANKHEKLQLSKKPEPTKQPETKPQWFGDPNEHPDKIHILALLRSENYSELEKIFTDHEVAFENDFRFETWMWDAYQSFDNSDPTLERLLDKWILKFPLSYSARGARAAYFEHAGWNARGDKFIAETSDQQLETMGSYFKRAESDANRALSLNPKLLISYDVLMGIAQSHGDLQANDRFLQTALKSCPYCFSIRAERMIALTPRWGGSYEEMTSFAEESEKFLEQNPKIGYLRGYIPWDMAQMLEINSKGDPSIIEYYTQAISYGEHWFFLTDRGEYLARQKEFQKALIDLERSDAIRPQKQKTLKWLGYVRYNTGDVEKSKHDFQIAYQLDPTDSYVQQWVNFLGLN